MNRLRILDHWVVPISVIYLARCTVTVATCVDGIILKSLQRKVKINVLAVYSSQPDAGTIEQTIDSTYRDTADLRVKPERWQE